jgi:hypothetical protein
MRIAIAANDYASRIVARQQHDFSATTACFSPPCGQ